MRRLMDTTGSKQREGARVSSPKPKTFTLDVNIRNILCLHQILNGCYITGQSDIILFLIIPTSLEHCVFFSH